MTIAPNRATREELRKACDAINSDLARRRTGLVWTLGIAVAAVVSALVVRPEAAPPVAVIGFLANFWFARYTRRALGREYKMGLALGIVPLLRPGLSFSPIGSIGVADFNGLRLFSERADRVTAEDEVHGTLNEVSYSVQELEATYTRTTGSGKSRTRTTYTVFRGSAVRLEFNKHFSGHTVVVPEYFGAGLLSGLLEGSSRTVTLENADFERAFIARSTDDHEARYLLTPRFMEVILEARRSLGDGLRLAFHQDQLLVLVPGTADRFEVSLFTGIAPSDTVNDLNAVIGLAEQLIETFSLETRIWTRA